MAAIKNLVILNPADKTRFYSVASGEGAPADVSGKKFYVRMAENKAVADWVAVNAGE